MSSRANVILLIGSLVSGSNANAASLTTLVSSEGISIVLRGNLELGDVEAFESLIHRMNKDGPSPQRLLLDSPGGNLLGGIGLARLIQRRGDLATMVAYGSSCASACFLVFAAGSKKFADYNSFIGVHGVADNEGHVNERTTAATLAMARVTEELGVPAEINAKIISTPPDEIVWLTTEDLKSMGTTMTGRPVQSPRGGSREYGPQKRESSIEDLNFVQARERAIQITQALEAAQRAEAERRTRDWISFHKKDLAD